MRIQTYQRQQVEPDTAGGVLRRGSGVAEDGAARGLAVLQAATLERAQRAQAAQRNTDVAIRTLALRQQYGQWWVQRSASPAGYQTLAKEANDTLAQLGEAALKGVDDPLTQAAIAQEVAEFSTLQGIEAEKTQIAHQVAWSRAALEDQLFLRRQEVAGVSPAERNRLMGETMMILQGAQAAGYITPLDAEKKARAFVDGVAEDELNLRVYNEPDAVLRDLYAGKYNAISVDVRQRLTINAEKRSEALNNQAVAQQRRDAEENRKAHREVQDLNFGEYYGYIVRGEQFDLDEPLRRGEIRGDQYRTLYDTQRAIASEGGPGNPTVASQLEMKAYRGELAVGDILDTLESPDGINAKERDKLLQLISQGATATNTRDYKEAVKVIDDALGVLNNPYGGPGRTNIVAGLAQRELYVRATSDPNFDALTAASDIIERYSVKNDKQPIAPRYRTRAEAMGAYRRGEIDEREFDNEIRLFMRNEKVAPP